MYSNRDISAVFLSNLWRPEGKCTHSQEQNFPPVSSKCSQKLQKPYISPENQSLNLQWPMRSKCPHSEVQGLHCPVLWPWASLPLPLLCSPQLENMKGNFWPKLLFGPITKCLWNCFRRHVLSFLIIINSTYHSMANTCIKCKFSKCSPN